MTTQFKMVEIPANAGWIDTGLSVTGAQRLVIHATGAVHLYRPQDEYAMPWVDPDGCPSPEDCPYLTDTWRFYMPDAPGAKLIGGTGSTIPPSNMFEVGKKYDRNEHTTGQLYLCVNDYQGYFSDNRGAFHALILVDPPDECPQTGDDCEINYREPTSSNPIRLRTADKVLSETDLLLQSPVETLSFVRLYAQSRQADSSYQFMGLGWTHNHAVRLTLSGSSPERVAVVRLPGGGILTLDEDSTGHFVARAGSATVMDHDAASNAYLLTLSDNSQYVFDDTTLRLQERRWPGGEKWMYAHDGSGNLTKVEDEYGRELVFAYFSGLNGDDAYKNGQLWRVGDQTATGLEGSSPTGRYVELDYAPEKSDGQRVFEAKPLLAIVRDVGGYYWTYDYYGQHAGEDDSNWLNFLTRRQSPEVDTDGDHVPDITVTLEELLYSRDLELALDGGMELADTDPNNPWQTVGDNIGHARSGDQQYEGDYSRIAYNHLLGQGVGDGFEGNPWMMVGGRTYTITARAYVISGTVTMQVAGELGSDSVNGPSDGWEELRLVFTPGTSPDEPRRVQFVIGALDGNGEARFFVDAVSVLETNQDASRIIQKRGNDLLETEFVFPLFDVIIRGTD